MHTAYHGRIYLVNSLFCLKSPCTVFVYGVYIPFLVPTLFQEWIFPPVTPTLVVGWRAEQSPQTCPKLQALILEDLHHPPPHALTK